jgi:Fic family protein
VYDAYMSRYIWQLPDWPNLTFDASLLLASLGELAYAQGIVETLLAQTGIPEKFEFEAQILTDEIYHSHEIEGEHLEQVKLYSSLCRRLHVPNASMKLSGPHIEGVVESLLDALKGSDKPVSHERLFSWHRTLFPQNISGPFSIRTGAYRTDAIAVVEGSFKNQRVLFQAPPAESVLQEMEAFLTWVNTPSTIPNVVKSAIAHLWFLTIHPFEDGNGRMARIISDYVLNQNNTENKVFFSLATRLKIHQKEYYKQLQMAQSGDLECTTWIVWYLSQIHEAQETVINTIEKVLKIQGWFQRYTFNERQKAMLERLTTDFYGELTTQKWAKLSHCSHDTAIRDIKDLIANGILRQSERGGRSTSYSLVL